MDGKKVQKVLMIFFACTAATVMLQLVAPLLLGIFVNVASFSIPFVVYYLFAVKKWKIKIIKPGKEGEPASTEFEENKEPLEPGDAGDRQEEAADTLAYEWYTAGGRERIQAIASNIFAKGNEEFWIRTDGICNIRTRKGYRRFGNLPGYPGAKADVITAYLRQDGFRAVNNGRYIYVSM